MRKKKLLAVVLCALMAAMALSGCNSKKERPEETVPKEEEYETDDDSYETFETLLQNLETGLNEGDVVQMKESFAEENVPDVFLTVSGNYVLEFELIGILDDVILEGDEIEQTLMKDDLIGEEYEEYARQATKACILEVAVEQTTASGDSVQSNDETLMIALKIEGKWAVVPWIS